MEIAKLVLEYLKIIFAPQLIVGAITVFCVVVFREDIKELIKRIAKIKLPGGGEFVTQEDKLKEESSKQNVPPPSIDTNADKIEITRMDAQKILEVVNGERTNARLWEYKYLNHFLVLGTQRVFDWLISLQVRPTMNIYDNFWMPIIPGAKERAAVLQALETHHLIQITGDLIEVTDKGREYQQWRGPLPKA